MDATDASLETLQIKIAFLERANTELSDVVYRQQRELGVLAQQLKVLSQRLDAASLEERARSADDERPPHY